MPHHPQPIEDLPPISTRSLSQLRQECQAQLDRFRRTHNRDVASRSCDEILRRAAAGDAAAFDVLWEISIPLVRSHCPPELLFAIDDVQQLVAERLIRKFRSRTSPYRAEGFAAYRTYLNLTLKSVCLNMQQRDPACESLNRLHTTRRLEAVEPSTIRRVERLLMLQRCMALLPDDLHREVFRLRIVLQEEVETIVAELQPLAPGLTLREVYRLAERNIRLLRNMPEVREMLEIDGGKS